MIRTNAFLCLCVSAIAVHGAVAGVTLKAPSEGAVVPQLWPEQKEFCETPLGKRISVVRTDNESSGRTTELMVRRCSAMPVRLEWEGDSGRYHVTVSREPDGKVFYSQNVSSNAVELTGLLEIARDWKWTVSDGESSATGRFSTEDYAPRIVRWPGVSNVRDIGGRMGLDGRRVKQGLIFRSGGLNDNSNYKYYTYDEIIAMHKTGTLSKAGIGKSRHLGAEYAAKLRSGEGIDRNHIRLIKSPPSKPGAPRLTEESRAYVQSNFGIKVDLDLRGDWECFGMAGSPLGDDVLWRHYPCWGSYGAFVKPLGRASLAAAFSLLLDERNYPMVIHCIGGTDRTGTYAYLINGLLGVSEDELILDYDISFIGGRGPDERHRRWQKSLADAVRALPGDTIPEKLKGYFISLGFTAEEVERVREFLLEPKAVPSARKADVVIYGATSAGLAAAVQVRRMGLEPLVVEPSPCIGGLTTGGLGQTDSGIKESFGGIARQFYKDIKAYYEKDDSWVFQKRCEYRPRKMTCWESGEDSMWTFEPSAARKVLDGWVRKNRIAVCRNERLVRTPGGVEKKDGRIVAIRTESGRRFEGKMFLDCTYEGDLIAAAGVSCTIGREPNSKYGETINGIQRARMKNHQLNEGVDPYVRKGDPSSGLLPGVEVDVDAPDGSGDSRVQAYCYRMCLTDDPRNMIPFEKPQGYRELDYELLLRNLEAGPLDPGHNGMPWINSPMPNRKTDTNNRTGFSTDLIGGADRWPEASYAEREVIALRHLEYQKGLMWTLANNPRVPERIRNEVARWGMCKDEFVGERGGGWQYQLYVREARRMLGEYVMTEMNCRGKRVAPRPVALATYGMDSHNCRRYVAKGGFVLNEGNIEDYSKNLPGLPFERFQPYPIDYGAIVPKRGECSNLLVPVCVSASHVAFGSIRMEPVFFALGQAAATAASQAIEDCCAVQDVDYGRLRERLLKDGQRLSLKRKDY